MEKFTLSEAFEFDGKVYNEVEYDLKSLKGVHFAEIKDAVDMIKGDATYVPAFDTRFQMHTMAKAAKLPVEFFEQLPMNDCAELCTVALVFLLNSGSQGKK